jgi:hypothetical protein
LKLEWQGAPLFQEDNFRGKEPESRKDDEDDDK